MEIASDIRDPKLKLQFFILIEPFNHIRLKEPINPRRLLQLFDISTRHRAYEKTQAPSPQEQQNL